MYRFTGFFARPLVERPAALPAGAVWRVIGAPFAGVGVSLPELANHEPGPDEVRRLLVGLGAAAADWLFIDYVTWAGSIDCVYGRVSSGGRAFGPVGESARDTVRASYLALMGAFGVAEADALRALSNGGTPLRPPWQGPLPPHRQARRLLPRLAKR